MRRTWIPAAFVAVLAALLLVSRQRERGSSSRAMPGETREEARGASDEPPKPDPGRGDVSGPEADDLRRDYLVGGHAVDSSGRPVPKAEVHLRQGCGDVSWGENLETAAAVDGGFRFEGVAQGPCELRVKAAGFAAVMAEVNSGDGSVEVVLRRPASVEGLIVDGDGRPVAAKLLRISDRRMMPGGDYQQDDVDDSGRFRLKGRTPGTLVLRAITEDGREGEIAVNVREGDEIRDLRIPVKPPWRSHVRVRALVAKGSPRDVWFAKDGDDPRVEWQGEVATLLFRDPPGATVPLCVRENGVFGDDCRCRTTDRVLMTAPLADPAVIDIQLPELVPVRVETDPPVPGVRAKFSHFGDEGRKKDGSWLLSPECPYSAEVWAEGFLPVEVEDWRPPAGGGVLMVPLRRAAVVRGVVLDAEGAPLEGAKFGLGPSNATTGPDGRFSFSTDEVGDHVLVASHRYRAVAAARVLLEPGRETDAGTLDVPPWRTIRGRVVDEAGRPVGGAAVAFVAVLKSDRPPAPSWWSDDTYSHANGAYELKVPAGDGFLLVEKRGYGTTPVLPDRAEEIVLPRPALVRVDAADDESTCSVRWPDLVPNAIWHVDRYLPHTVEVAPGRIEVILDNDPNRTRTIDAAQSATAQVKFER